MLGHIVSKNGVEPDPEKKTLIMAKTKKLLKKFVSLPHLQDIIDL